MAESAIPLRTTDPVFEDSSYEYIKRSASVVSNTFPSTPTYSEYKYTFNIAKSGYKAVGVVSYTLRNDYVPYSTMDDTVVSFDYTNQTVTLFDKPQATGTEVSFAATIKYLKL